ncbi:MAG TPA: TonB-dependent receptor [Pyrinomonadaceae bacterium]|jgi:outer membrane receptor protein involved in Fe transport|nr:TonB-dependent receptor [Pyrinomonadaceae bacterium]
MIYHRRVPKGLKLQNRIAVGLAFILLCCGQAAAQTLSGVVTDERGSPVAGAFVTAREEGTSSTARGTTNGEGRFALSPVPSRSFTLVVEAEGFARFERVLKSGEFVRVVLAPAGLAERVTVTASRTEARLGETAASVVVLGSEELESTAALTSDDALRQVPGFQLFRRTGSRAANPTAQGVSLRGVGASGAGRAVVLADGVPLADPFGGWVYWGRVARASLERAEVLRGGASSLYGSAALGGAVQFVTRKARANALALELSYGSQATADGSLFLSGARGGWGASLAAEIFRTEGYVLVSGRERGRVDTPAASRHATTELTVERRFGEASSVFARGSFYGESRQNGTPLQFNRTHLRQLVAGGDRRNARAGDFGLRAYASAQVFDQSFTAVSADRSAETLTRLQRTPAQAAGLNFQWARLFGARHALVAGAEAREVRGASDEVVYVANRPSSLVGAGGRERSFGVFARDAVRLTPRLVITPGARLDRWRESEGRQTTRPLAGPSTSVVIFKDRAEKAFSPQLSALFRAGERLSLNASASRAFRAPTLNELYRSFRVGNVLTLANEALRAERLTGAEAGFLLEAPRRVSVRGTAFWSEVTRAVSNVTLSATPALITRRRENLGRTRSRGFEAEVEARVSGRLTLSGGYLLSDARVVRFPANVALEGLRVPQVALQQATFQARYRDASGLTLAAQGRAGGAQYDDDQNLLRLGRYFTLDAFASKRLRRGLELFAAAENLTGARYDVGRTPVLTVGPPVSVRFGLRLKLAGN